MARIDDQLSRGFDAGNYANAYETEDLDRALRQIESESDAFRTAFILGFFASYELNEIGSGREEFDQAYWSDAGKRVLELGFTESREDDYQSEHAEFSGASGALTPKRIATRYKKALQRIRPKPQSVTVRKVEQTLPRGWDWGAYVVLDIVLADGDTVSAAIVLYASDNHTGQEASGNVKLDAAYGGVISTARAQTPDEVIRRLMSDTVSHLSREGLSMALGEIRRRGPGKFETVLDSYLWELSLDGGADKEAGYEEGGGWFGVLYFDAGMLASLQNAAGDNDDKLTQDEADEILKNFGVILFERSDGIVEVAWYEKQSDLEADWNRILEDTYGPEDNGD